MSPAKKRVTRAKRAGRKTAARKIAARKTGMRKTGARRTGARKTGARKAASSRTRGGAKKAAARKRSATPRKTAPPRKRRVVRAKPQPVVAPAVTPPLPGSPVVAVAGVSDTTQQPPEPSQPS